jgi:hypothetical protein
MSKLLDHGCGLGEDLLGCHGNSRDDHRGQ